MSVKNFLHEWETLPEEEVLHRLDALADEMKERVTEAADDWYSRKRVIYVSEAGNDENDGLSEDTPIRSLSKVQEMMQELDTFLFRRGDMFRGKLVIEVNGVTLAAYGKGKKPIINGSAKDYADESLWVKTECENVWKCTDKLNNVGIIHLNCSYEYGAYDELAGDMCCLGRTKNFAGIADMHAERQFYSDLDNNDLYLYCAGGNPGSYYTSIEIGTCGNTVRVNADNFMVDNLHIMHTGSHGVAGRAVNLTVKNSVFDWLGGSVLKGFGGGNTIRYGNAIETGGCNGYLVKNNWIYQIYDTGITHQAGPQAKCDVHQYNVLYLDNLVEFCYWSLEFYNGENEFFRDIRNVYIHGNMCRYGGFGWGCRERVHGAPMFCSSTCCADVRDFCVENNIFDRCDGLMIFLFAGQEGNKKIQFRSNVYVQPRNVKFLKAENVEYSFDENVKETIDRFVHDKTPACLYLSDFYMQMK